MVKSVLSTSHQGVRDWVIQRVSAILMAVYSVGLALYFICHPDLTYSEWHDMFSQDWVKIATLLFLISLLFHAWVGMWTIFTDYIKPYILRSVLNLLTLLMLVACFMWGVLILWSV